MEQKNMPPKEILSALKERKITMAGISRDLNKSPSTIRRTIYGEVVSDPIRRHLAKCIEKPVEQIWPETYLVKKDPTKRGRPITKGLYDAA